MNSIIITKTYDVDFSPSTEMREICKTNRYSSTPNQESKNEMIVYLLDKTFALTHNLKHVSLQRAL